MRRLGLLLAMIACLALGASNARADDKQEAERHFRLGVSLQKVEDFDAAAKEFEASLQLFPTKSALFNLANCLRGMHEYAKALAAFERLQEQYADELKEPMLGAVKTQMKQLEEFVGWLKLEISPPTASVWVDGEQIDPSALAEPLRLSLGKHEVTVSLEGYEAQSVVVQLGAKQTIAQPISLVKTPVPAAPTPLFEPTEKAGPEPKAQPLSPVVAGAPSGETAAASHPSTLGLVTSGVGAALLIGGTATGLWALSLDSDLKNACQDGHCPVDRASDVNRLDTLTTASNVLFGLGAAAAAGGLLLWLFDSGDAGANGSDRVGMTSVNVSLAGGYAGAKVKTRF